jgi:CBS domain-containing protein
MQTVLQLLQAKSGSILSVSSNQTVFEALTVMADHDIGALAVLEDGQLVGMFSERDYARKVILHGKSSKELRVADIMSKPVLTVRPPETVRDCMSLMTENHIRHLPVVEGSGVIGMISIGDVVKSLLSEQAFTIEQLEHYITG